MARRTHVAVLGATGVVGREMLRVLAARRFPAERVVAIASARSAGASVPFGEGEILVTALDGARSFTGIDIALFSAGASVSREVAPLAAAAGAVVIDNSSAWRMDTDVPLVVPEVNLEAAFHRPRGIIANPNCSTIQLVVVLNAIRKVAGLTRVVISTYQAISGAGWRALAELDQQTRDSAEGRPLRAEVLPSPILGNLLFHDVKEDSGYTEEELKIIRETQKILAIPQLPISATCVRVPVQIGHCEAVWIETERKLTPAQTRDLLSHSPGVVVQDQPAQREYPLPRMVAGTDPVYVGRIREDLSRENGLVMWIVADNLRKGAALNAVQIAEALAERGT